MCGVRAAQGVGEEVFDGHRPGVDAGPAAVWVPEEAELDADLRILTAAAADGLAEQEFVMAHAVEVGRVEQGDARVEGRLDGGDAPAIVSGADPGHAGAAPCFLAVDRSV